MLCSVANGYACDVCGGAGGGQGLGILPMSYRNFAGLQYQYRSFSSVQTSLLEGKPAVHSNEYYNTIQVWARVHISKRVQLFAFLPYQQNRRLIDATEYRYTGMGDASLWANVTLLKTVDTSGSDWRHMLIAGASIKMPTGKYALHSKTGTEDILNIQPGTGTWDPAVNANYTLRYKKAGINAEASYTFTTTDAESYKYGNRLVAALRGFYTLSAGDFTLVPQVGFRYDYALHDYDNYKRKWLNESSGGYIGYAVAGVQVYYKRIGLQLNCNKPVTQYYGAGNVTAHTMADATLMYLF